MDYLLIKGPAVLDGTVAVSGSKNAALPMLVASILSKKFVQITNLPRLSDIDFTLKLLVELGGNVRMIRENNSISANIEFKDTAHCVAPYDLVRKMRSSILVMGPLLARYGHVTVSMPGGCAIGARPVDLHEMIMRKLGADIDVSDGNFVVKCKKLKGSEIVFPFVSVGATQAAMMTAVLAKGTTVLKNVSTEPETVETGHMLNKMGAKIHGLGTENLIIDGADSDTLPGTGDPIPVIPDRIEAGTYAIAAAATGGKVRITNAIPGHLEILIYNLRESGVKVDVGDNHFTVDAGSVKSIKPVDIITAPYPGFPTDLQAQWMSYMCIADGISTIDEQIFKNRYIHVGELMRLGARVKLSGTVATVLGNRKLKGAPVMATDLRASASLVIAGLVADGQTEVHRVYHIDRGYERIDEKLLSLGAEIERLREGD
ncbi:MAG: UDP-N-acetylglucosamine 1-carboxyvinyltransferase [Oligoflexia bacterium]|nr:UDP-N-acetylglucosamine 1-carboxyvinyltransferase [Oligoflexia bacterium]